MSFWDTVKGHNLADILIYCLPRLVEKMEEKTEQYTEVVDNFEIKKIVDEELRKGAKVVSMTTASSRTFIVFERKCN